MLDVAPSGKKLRPGLASPIPRWSFAAISAAGFDPASARRKKCEKAVAEWRERNPKGARGSNPYALEQFGLDAEAVAEQFGAYMRHFDISREQVGLARAEA